MHKILLFGSILFIYICSLRGQEDDYLIKEFKEHKGKVNSVAFSKSGKYLASGGEDKLLVIRNLADEGLDIEFPENYFPVKDIEFFGDLQLFITAGRDVKLIDLHNKQLALYKGSNTHIWSLNYAPERNKLTAGSYDKNINIWDVNSQEVEFELNGHEKSALTVVFSKDEKYLVSGSRDQTLKVWSAKTGELLHSFERHTGNIYAVQFHPNTKYFASASEDKTIRLWDIEKEKVVKTYTGHDGSVLDIEFSPDGYYMYSAAVDGTVYIWEVSTGKKLYSYIQHVGGVNAVAVSNNGHYVATAGDDGKVFLWKSAMAIAVDLEYRDKLEDERNNDSVFLSRQKGESKAEYIHRSSEALKAEEKLVEKYFSLYLQKNDLKNLPIE